MSWFPQAVLARPSGSCIAAKGTSFHSQKSCGLGNRVDGHLSNNKTSNALKKDRAKE